MRDLLSIRHVLGVTLCAVLTVSSSGAVAAERAESERKAAELNAAAVLEYRQRDFVQAEESLWTASAYSESHPALHRNLSMVQYEKGMQVLREGKDPLEAQQLLKKAYETDPENGHYRRAYAAALSAHASVKAEEGKKEEAVQLHEKAAFLDAQNIAVWLKAADYAWTVHLPQRAAAYYYQATAIDPEHPQVLQMKERIDNMVSEAEFPRRESEHFIVVYGKGGLQPEEERRLLIEIERAYDEAVFKLNTDFAGKITAVIYPEDTFHAIWDVPPHVSAIYNGKIRLPWPGRGENLDVFRAVVRHELSHAMLQWMVPARLPRWLEEGLAEWIEGIQLNEQAMHLLESPDYLAGARGLGELDADLAQRDRRAYLKAFSLTDYFIRKFGLLPVRQFLSKLNDRSEFANQFERHFGLSVSAFEAEWKDYLRR